MKGDSDRTLDGSFFPPHNVKITYRFTLGCIDVVT